MKAVRRRSAAEVIAFFFGWDVRDVRDIEYRAGRSKYPLFSHDTEVYCCPPAEKGPPQDRDLGHVYDWYQVGEAYGRKIYCSGERASELAARFNKSK